MKKKKSQIFMLDMIFSVVLLIIIIGFFYSFYYETAGNTNIVKTAHNIQRGFTNTKINDLNDDIIVDFFRANKIKNIENSIIQQIIIFNDEGDSEYAINLTREYAKNFDSKREFNIEINIKKLGINTTLYEESSKKQIDFDKANTVVQNNRQIIAFDNLNNKFYGPYDFEVKLWK